MADPVSVGLGIATSLFGISGLSGDSPRSPAWNALLAAFLLEHPERAVGYRAPAEPPKPAPGGGGAQPPFYPPVPTSPGPPSGGVPRGQRGGTFRIPSGISAKLRGLFERYGAILQRGFVPAWFAAEIWRIIDEINRTNEAERKAESERWARSIEGQLEAIEELGRVARAEEAEARAQDREDARVQRQIEAEDRREAARVKREAQAEAKRVRKEAEAAAAAERKALKKALDVKFRIPKKMPAPKSTDPLKQAQRQRRIDDLIQLGGRVLGQYATGLQIGALADLRRSALTLPAEPMGFVDPLSQPQPYFGDLTQVNAASLGSAADSDLVCYRKSERRKRRKRRGVRRVCYDRKVS